MPSEKSTVTPHPPGTFEFAFDHRKGDPWRLTDGYGYSKAVSPPVWLFYRLGRKWRTERFNRATRALSQRVSYGVVYGETLGEMRRRVEGER